MGAVPRVRKSDRGLGRRCFGNAASSAQNPIELLRMYCVSGNNFIDDCGIPARCYNGEFALSDDRRRSLSSLFPIEVRIARHALALPCNKS